MALAGTSKYVPTRRSANFVAETSGTQLAVIGANLGLSNGNRVFYRVIAVDGLGNRSGPSDFIEAPRPVLVSQPVLTAKVGFGISLCSRIPAMAGAICEPVS